MNKTDTNKHEEGLILILLGLSIIVLTWLFTPFLPALFFSMLITIASYGLYQKLTKKISKKISAMLMTTIFSIIFIIPISYLILFITLKMGSMIVLLQDGFQIKEIQSIISNSIINIIPEEYRKEILSEEVLKKNINTIFATTSDFLLKILKNITSVSGKMLFFVIIAVFSLYYFYIDGISVIKKIKKISPMDENINNVLIKQFSSLSVILVSSVFIISILQGLSFFIAASIVGLPALFLGIAITIASFIPILGGMLVWLPTAIYLFAIDEIISGFIILFFGAIIAGIVIDNIIRPIIINKLAKKMNHKIAINHTLITVLSIIAGVIKFGVLGLLIGPIISAMAITMIDIYKIKYR